MVVSYPTNEAEAIKLFHIARKGAQRVTIDRDQSLSIISIIAFERKTIGCFCPPRFWIGWEDFCNIIHYRLDLAAFEGKRRVTEMPDVRGTFAKVGDEKFLYVSS
jgi:hypothetical protein